MVPVPDGVSMPALMVPGPLVTAKVPPAGLPASGRVALMHRAALLLVMDAMGGTQMPGAVDTAADTGLFTVLSLMQEQRVSIFKIATVCV